MEKKIRSIRGIHDYLPNEIKIWHKVEKKIKKILSTYSFEEIRTPILEKSNLFCKTIGENTDIIKKEMYTFIGKNGEKITLRPENTTGCVRAAIQNNLIKKIQRWWYIGPMFRYERPQKGRYRQFYQLGVEIFGLSGPNIDAELIAMNARLWKKLKINHHISLEINSIGSIKNRKKYTEILIPFLQYHKKELDKKSINNIKKNPIKIFDSKNKKTQKLLNKAPNLFDYIDEKSKKHFIKFCKLLKLMNIKYKINKKLVRGLDYYNNTVFEWKTNLLGSQETICAGGRYDQLTEILGGKPTKAIGFGIGLDRLILLMKKLNLKSVSNDKIDIYVINCIKNKEEISLILTEEIRNDLPNIKILIDHIGGNLKKKIQRANKYNAKIALILFEKEYSYQEIIVKNLKVKKQKKIKIKNIIKYLKKIL